jgi:GNAT superfamily N-acetyltransferase
MTGTTAELDFVAHPLTIERWPDLEVLFGPRGACGGCWCMVWRLTRSDFDRQKGAGNRRDFKTIVESGAMPGLLGYASAQPVAWCAVAPRQSYPALERSRILKPVDEQPVWSVTCLFVARSFRRQGLTVRLLKAAADHARQRGAHVVEGYPVEPKTVDMPAAFAWTGTASAFRQAGFAEVLRRSPTRPIMRYICR